MPEPLSPMDPCPAYSVDDLPVPPQRQRELTELVLRMEDIVQMAGMRRFDRVRLVMTYDEVWCIWDEEKLVVIVEMGATPEAAEEAFRRATAGAGDAALN